MSNRANNIKEFSEIPRHYLERLYFLRFYEDREVTYEEYVKRYGTVEADGIFYYREDQKSKIADWVRGGIAGLQISDAVIAGGDVIKNRLGRTVPSDPDHSLYGNANVKERIYYIGVNSDNTAIISTVPLVRFLGREDADKKEICFSYSDSERPPHWIPQDERPKEAKWGYAYIGEYINTDRDFVSRVLRRDLSWEDDAVKLVTSFVYVPPKEEKFDVQELKELIEAYDETVREKQDS